MTYRTGSKVESRKSFILLSTLSEISLSSQAQTAEPEWKFTLKNAYIEQDFDSSGVKNFGSWSPSASLFYTSKMRETPPL
ncbi:hypothetical protein AY606_12080 [Acinetobacter sp. SFB]|nr:hypothetical protein [Acinetobacter sp. SFB]OAL76707.1 hypothetical protein AY606_12080 [Acinetobacter sp. SFB]